MINRRAVSFGLLNALFLPALKAAAAPLSYALKATPIADKTYVVYGKREYFTPENGGNIVNVAFIDTADGVVLIDTGSTRRYGLALRDLIRRTTGKDVVRVYITHHHPDHFLGNQAFASDHIASLPAVIANINKDGDGFAENLYRLIGDWMRGTQVVAPQIALKTESEMIGGHEFAFHALAGHTSADLAIIDKKSGTLFAGDLVFLDRAATTPHANLKTWHKSLQALRKLSFARIVPGHGPVEAGKRAIKQTSDYLTWLEATLAKAVDDGLDMTEVMVLPLPERFASLAVVRNEFQRSIAHLYPDLENKKLPLVGQGG